MMTKNTQYFLPSIMGTAISFLGFVLSILNKPGTPFNVLTSIANLYPARFIDHFNSLDIYAAPSLSLIFGGIGVTLSLILTMLFFAFDQSFKEKRKRMFDNMLISFALPFSIYLSATLFISAAMLFFIIINIWI